MKIIQIKTLRRKPARRGHPALEAGSLLWLIEYSNNPPRYYHYGYVLKTTAAKVMSRLTGTQNELDWNSFNDPEQVLQAWNEPPV